MGLLDKFKKGKKKEEKAEETAKVESGKKTAERKPSMKELYAGEKDGGIKKGLKDGKAKEAGEKVKQYGNAYRVLKKPLVTEKATELGKHNQYVFEVANKTNKIEIARAISEIYGIKPVAVNIVKMKGKTTNYGRVRGKRKDWKKAIITLPAGKSIKLYEGV